MKGRIRDEMGEPFNTIFDLDSRVDGVRVSGEASFPCRRSRSLLSGRAYCMGLRSWNPSASRWVDW